MKMKKKKFKIIFLIIVCLFFYSISFAQNTNIGFVSSNIWYSDDPFSDGDEIKIYTLIFNQNEKELHGTVTFYDQNIVLGKKDFILKKEESKIISLDWTVTPGSHTIFAKITNSKFLTLNGEYEDVLIDDNESEKSEKIVLKKVIPKVNEIKDKIEEKTENTLKPIEKIGMNIVEKTPDIISIPLINTIDALEQLREETSIFSLNQKEEIKKELEKDKEERKQKIDNKIELKEDLNSNEEKENLFKPFKYVKMFFFSLAHFILNTKIVFYLIIFAILFSILRFIWVKIF